MQWASWSAFWEMGGAAAFVWGSYAVTAVLVTVELVTVLKRRKETVRRLLRLRRVTAGQESGRRSRDRS
jgi:heme exporter protein D